MADTKCVQQSVIEILYEREENQLIAEEISYGVEEQGVKARVRQFRDGKEPFVQVFESAQRGYGVALCILNDEIMVFAEDIGNEDPLFRYAIEYTDTVNKLRSVGKNSVHIITRQPFDHI